MLKFSRNGAVGFIDWLGLSLNRSNIYNFSILKLDCVVRITDPKVIAVVLYHVLAVGSLIFSDRELWADQYWKVALNLCPRLATQRHVELAIDTQEWQHETLLGPSVMLPKDVTQIDLMRVNGAPKV